MPVSRRDIFQALSGAAVCGAAGSLIPLTRSDAQVTPEVVALRPEMEPLVRLIENTPREKCAEMAVEQFRNGVSYRQFLGALFLAGVRNVNPRPPGFAMHCVFVIHSAHLISLEAPSEARWLPLFFALDNFKSAQDRDARQAAGDYTMRPLAGSLPSPERAGPELGSAMEAWDIERAERAAAALARNRSASEAFDLLWRYGARDYRNIGHKAIYVANACRTLQAIGWQHAEPVLRSLVLSLLDFGKEQKVNGYALDDQCYAGNLKRVKEMFPRLAVTWASAAADVETTRGILDVLRQATPDEACSELANRLVKGSAGAASVWDAVHLAAAELRMRARSGAAILAIHAVTSANGLRYAYQSAPDPQLRFLVLLQAAGWMGQFRSFAESREGNLRPYRITDLVPAAADVPLERNLGEIFAGIPAKVDDSAARVFHLARSMAGRQAFLATALRFTAAKTEEVHFYKYLAAMIEDIPLTSAEWQPHLLAATTYYVKGSNDAEPAAVKRAREALRSLAV